jgi:hypothetical protein
MLDLENINELFESWNIIIIIRGSIISDGHKKILNREKKTSNCFISCVFICLRSEENLILIYIRYKYATPTLPLYVGEKEEEQKRKITYKNSCCSIIKKEISAVNPFIHYQ